MTALKLLFPFCGVAKDAQYVFRVHLRFVKQEVITTSRGAGHTIQRQLLRFMSLTCVYKYFDNTNKKIIYVVQTVIQIIIQK